MIKYCLEQLTIWILIYAVFLYWSIAFPFNFRQLKTSGRIHHAHIISVILAVFVPLPSALVHLQDGFVPIDNPVHFCVGRDVDYVYYFNILPISIILSITSCLLVLSIWKIFKV